MVAYHMNWPGSDPFYNANPTENTERRTFYGVSYVPDLYIDGSLHAGYTGPWEQWMLDRHAVDSPLTIAVTGALDTPTAGTIDATITNTSAGVVSGYLHFILIEDNVTHSGTVYGHIMRDFIPTDTAGELVTLNPSDVIVRSAAFTITTGAPPAGWTRANMEAIVFVQNNTTKEIYQTGRIYFELDDPEIQRISQTVDDTAGGDGNGNLDPAESADLILTLGQLNPTTATGVTGTLSTTSPYVIISDANGSWPDMASGTTGDNAGDLIGLSALSTTPYGTVAALKLTVTSNGGGYSTDIWISLPIGSPHHPIGPESYGYYAYEETDDYPPSPTYSWVEINPNLGGAGTLFTMNDDQVRQIDFPFTFRYYGLDYTRLSICSNGWIAWGNQGGSSPSNGPIPGPDGPPNMVAAFWTDLNPLEPTGGKVYTYYDTANHRYILEFSGVEHYDGAGAGLPETFEYIVYDPAYHQTLSGDGEIVVQYNLVSDASSCTAGMENAAETDGLQYQALGVVNAAAHGLASGRAIKYTTMPPNSASVDEGAPLPVRLLQSRPNPVRGGAQIHYDIPTAGHVTLRIFDATGAVVRTLIDGTRPAGAGHVAWDGRNDRGSIAPAGVYFYRMNGDGFAINRKIVKD